MTESSIITAPTLEQRALAISACCPAGWVVRPLGPSLAVFSPSDLRTPYSVMHGDDLQVLAAVWGWYAGVIEMKASITLSTQAARLAEVVAEFSAGMFTPTDFIHRAVDVDEALREIRERRRLDREERDVRDAALAAKHEAELNHLRDQLAEARDYARREMVWVPGSVAGMSTSEQIAAAMREETGADVEPRPHSRSNVMDEVLGLGEQTERFDRAATGASPVPPAKPREGFASMLGRLVQAGEQIRGTAVGTVRPDSCGNPIRWTGVEWVPVEEPVQTVASEAYLGETTPRFVFELGPVPVRAAGWTGITWMSRKGRAKSLTVPGLRAHIMRTTGAELDVPEASGKLLKVLARDGRLFAFHLPAGVVRCAAVQAVEGVGPLRIVVSFPKESNVRLAKPVRQGA